MRAKLEETEKPMVWTLTEKGRFVLDSVLPTEPQRRVLEDIRDHGDPSHRADVSMHGAVAATLRALRRFGWVEST